MSNNDNTEQDEATIIIEQAPKAAIRSSLTLDYISDTGVVYGTSHLGLLIPECG